MHKILNVSFDHDLISSFHDLEQLNCHIQQCTKLSYTNKNEFQRSSILFWAKKTGPSVDLFHDHLFQLG